MCVCGVPSSSRPGLHNCSCSPGRDRLAGLHIGFNVCVLRFMLVCIKAQQLGMVTGAIVIAKSDYIDSVCVSPCIVTCCRDE